MRPSLTVLAVLLGSLAAFRAGAAPLEASLETQALVQRLVLDRAAFVAAERRVADEREERLLAELAEKDRRLRAEQKAKKASTAGWKRAADTLLKVTVARLKLVDELAARDRQLTAEIAEYRSQVASIAGSPDPRKRAALARYAEGERTGAFDDLVAIQEELDKATDKASAAGWRELGALALDLKDRGEKDTNTVIALFERAQRKDPEDAWGWINLRRLYREVGRLDDARKAATTALEKAQGERDRAAAQAELGNVLLQAGDLLGARASYRPSLETMRALADADPGSAEAKRDLAVLLSKAGDLSLLARDFAGARSYFAESLEVRRKVLAANPESTVARREVLISLASLANAEMELEDLGAARRLYEESLKGFERLAAENPKSALARRDFGVSLNQTGNLLLHLGELAEAQARFEKSLGIFEALSAANPSSATARRDMTTSLEKLGRALLRRGDVAGARSRFEAHFQIQQELVAANPESFEARRSLAIAHMRLGELPGGGEHDREALAILLEFRAEGRLTPGDAIFLEAMRERIEEAEEAETPP